LPEQLQDFVLPVKRQDQAEEFLGLSYKL